MKTCAMNKLMVFSIIILVITGCNSETKKMEKDLKVFIDSLEMKVKPAEAGAAMAYFNAAVTGNAEEYDKSSAFNIPII